MPARRSERRLKAILAADAVGYGRMLAADEAATLNLFQSHLSTLRQKVRKHGGRIVKTMGDGVLAAFPSSLEALICAVEFQQAAIAGNRDVAQRARMEFRIGVHAGDVIVTEGDVLGDAVVLATRLQSVAKPGGICVSARVREDAQGRSKLHFDDMGEQKLKHVSQPVRVFNVHVEAAPALAAHPLPDKPSIAVLPFANMSGDADQEYFVDGLTEDIISALSRWHWFFVIARNSTFIYKGRAVDVAHVGRELGVRYVLEGSVRKSGSRVRVVAQLIDATDSSHIWTDTFDRDIADLFALHDEITEHVVAAIEPAMLHNEGVRATRKNAADLNAFDCFQRGMWHLNQVNRASFDQAETLFRQAIASDPSFALGHAGLARVLYGRTAYGWSADLTRDAQAAEVAARDALALDPREAWARFALSGALLYLGRHEEALKEAEQALTLNPNYAFGHYRLGQVLIYCGRAADAVAPLERSIRHSPLDPQMSAMIGTLALAHFHAGAYELAAERAREAARNENEKRAPIVLAASLARLSRIDEARAVLTDQVKARAVKLIGERRIPYARAEDRQDLVEALRLAGFDRLPELLAERERANSAMASDNG